MKNYKFLEYKWTISRGRDTYGWNICTLWDGDRAYRCNGGGYDMQGTVFGEWLMANHMEEIIEKVKPYDESNCNYGFHFRNDKYYLDGACGLDSMIRIAEKIGLEIERLVDKKGHLKGLYVSRKEI